MNSGSFQKWSWLPKCRVCVCHWYIYSFLFWQKMQPPATCSLGISNFLEEISSLSHSIVFLYSLHWSLRKAFLSLLAILWNSVFKWVYLSFSPLLFTSLLFTAICKASSNSHFAFLFLGDGWFLSPVQCHTSPSIVHQALCLSDLVP